MKYDPQAMPSPTQSRPGQATSGGRKRPRGGRLSASDRREQLLEVARIVFAKHGYEAVTVEEIAEQAGVSRPILYNHFGGKQGVFEAVVDGEIARVEEVVAGALAGEAEPEELLERGMRAFFDYVHANPDGHAVLTRDAPVHLSEAGLGKLMDGLAARITRVIAGAMTAGELDPKPAPIYANALIGVAAHVGRWWHDHPEVSLDEITAHTTSLLWGGLAGIQAAARD